MDRKESLVAAFRLQAGGCRHFGSPFYGALMDAALADVEQGGPLAELVAEWRGDPLRGFLPLRVLAAVHACVLAGEAPELARYYPSAGGSADAEAAWPLFRELAAGRPERLRPALENFPQTNEVRRCTGLLGGFLELAALTGLPLQLREIGCSAGLNLQWHRYHYLLGPHRWGDPDAPVQLACEWQGPPARFGQGVEVETRAGCDIAPRAIASAADVQVLESFVWADQPDRLEQLRAAVAVARADPPRIDTAAAGDWLAGELAARPDGCAVVYHSSMWLYLSAEEQERIRATLADHGARAKRERPLAWLRHEDGAQLGTVEVRLTLWPPGEERHLAMSHPHGRRVEWLSAPGG